MSDLDDEGEDYGDEDDYCDRCGGEGWIVTCCDDMCHGLGYCIHGDGMAMCACNRLGEPPADAPADWLLDEEDDPLNCDSPSHPGCRKCEVKS